MTLSRQDLKDLAEHIRKAGNAEGFTPSAPRKKRNNEEFQMQIALVAWWGENCHRWGVPEFLLWHTPNSAVYGGTKEQREKMGAMLKRLGQKSGVPDLFLAAPRKDRNQGRSDVECYEKWLPDLHGLFIELKSPRGVISPEQTEMLCELENRGYSACVCRTLEDAQKVIENYLR